jgi:hypothetical protein
METKAVGRPPLSAVQGALYRNRKWMAECVAEGLTRGQIAERAGCSEFTVSYWLKRFGFALVNPFETDMAQFESHEVGERIYQNQVWLYEMYIEHGLSLDQVGELAGVTQETVRYWLTKHGIQVRERGATEWQIVASG